MKQLTRTPHKTRKKTANRHADGMNQAPLFTIAAILITLFCLFVAIILAAVF